MNNVEQSSSDRHQQVVRPTEAQLRWSQFHHRRRAVQVKAQVEELWLQPPSVQEVQGARSDDGNTTEESQTKVSSATVPRSKPVISRGRRAMLRVSKRACTERQADIEKYGFFRGNETTGGASSSDDDDDDGLANLFAEEENFLRKRKRRHRRRNAAATDQERVRRFEAAFHAMMMNLAAAQPVNPAVQIPTKIWSRPDGPLTDTVDGREYMDLKWGVVNREHSVSKHGAGDLSMDRGASWLVHLPGKPVNSSARGGGGDDDGSAQPHIDYGVPADYQEYIEEHGFPPSPVRRRFTDIVSQVQQNVLNNAERSADRESAVPIMRLSKYYQPAQLEGYADDEKKEEEQLLQRYLEGATNETSRKRLEAVFAQVQGGSPSVHERVRDYSKETALTEEYIHDIIKSVDPDVVNELEALDPGISERLLMRYMEETNFDPSKDDVNAVCEHLEIFARRYLVEARYFEGQRDQEVAAVKSSLQVNQQRSNSLVMRFVDQIEETAVAEELISADGRLHKPTFAKLVMQYLGETDESLHRGDKVARRGSGRISERYLEQTTPDDKGQASNKQESSSTTDLVNRFIERMQDDAENESVVDAEGNWDRGVFEHVVSRYLAEASGVEEEVVLDAVDLQALCVGESKQETSRSVQHSGVKEASTAVDQGILETAGRKESSAAVTRAVLEPGRKEAPTAVDQGILEIVGRKEASAAVNQAVLEPRRISAAFTSRFIAQMEQAAEVETLTTEDGKLNKPVFEKLTTRYLVQASSSSRNNTAFLSQARSPLALAQARRNAGRGGRRKRVETPESVGDDEFAGAQSPGFIRRFIRQMEDAAEIEPFVTSEGKLDEATFEKLAKRYLAEAADQRVSVPTDGNADYTAFPPFGHSASIGFVQRFVAHMEEVSRGEELGAIDKPLLEELVLRCLVEFEKDGILDGGKDMESGESNAFDGDVGQLISSGFVEGLAGHLIMASAKDPLVDSDGNLDVSAFERQMTRYLVETASPSKNPVTTSRASARDRQGQFEEERTGQNLTVTKVHQADDATAASPVDTMSPTGSEFFKQMREADVDHPENRMQQNHSSRRGKDSSASITPTGNYQADGLVDRDVASTPQNQLIGDGDNAGDETTSNFGMAQRLAGSVSKVGGFVQMMYGKSRNKEEELEAVAAFRRTQGDRDDTSSLSSFRISDGIKQVVQGFRTSHLSPKDEADEHAFSGNDAGEDVVGDLARQSSYESYEDRASASLYSQDSYSQAESATASGTGFSPERAKIFHRMVMDKSALIGDANADRSIIDTDGSDASRSVIDPDVLKNLLLSPTILTKRHKQAIRAVEQRSWEQVSYLISANPWLAEMTDMGTSQYLLHKLALYGAGQANIDKNTGEVISIRDPAAPDQINTDLIRMFPASVHKFDQDGNLPLHMAAASANSSMIKLLGDRFPGGASVRNEDGMLPLHLTILACASPSIESLGSDGGPIGIIKNVLQYFPGAVAVVDNEGNLPIHTAAAALRGHIGVDVIYHLLDEAHRQLQSSSGARFRNKMKVEDMESASVTTETTIAPTDSANEFDDIVHCNMVRNEFDETPLLVAIHARAGWEMIEAIACGEGGLRAALWQDSGMNNSLHLLVSDRFKDSAAALSILKVAPEAATVRNDEGMLPIEVRTAIENVDSASRQSSHRSICFSSSSRSLACRCFLVKLSWLWCLLICRLILTRRSVSRSEMDSEAAGGISHASAMTTTLMSLTKSCLSFPIRKFARLAS